MPAKRLLVVAGEASGDAHGAALVRALRALGGEWAIAGMGGEGMAAAGVECLYRIEDVSVMGFVEVGGRARALLAAWRGLRRELRAGPDGIVLIDFPDFNLRLARYARRLGVPVVYYVSPQVWAWRRGRLRLIRRAIDRMLVLFPFEAELYREAGVPVEHVGHPLLDVIPPLGDDDRRRRLAVAAPARVALLPGSRPGEIERILPTFLEAAARLRAERAVELVLVRAPGLPAGLLEEVLAGSPAGGDVRLLTGRDDWWEQADLAWVASGTATLETALRGVPLIAAYRVSPLSYLIGRALVRVDHISLVNLVAGRRLVPELLQQGLTADNVLAETRQLLDDTGRRRQVIEGLGQVRQRLAVAGTAAGAAAKAVWEVLRLGERVTA